MQLRLLRGTISWKNYLYFLKKIYKNSISDLFSVNLNNIIFYKIYKLVQPNKNKIYKEFFFYVENKYATKII